jgi:hypothetical protein
MEGGNLGDLGVDGRAIKYVTQKMYVIVCA